MNTAIGGQACLTATPSYSLGQGLSTSDSFARDMRRPSQALVSSLGAVVLYAPQLPRLMAVAPRTISKYQSLYAPVQISLSDPAHHRDLAMLLHVAGGLQRMCKAHVQTTTPNTFLRTACLFFTRFLLMFLVAFEDWYLHLGRRYFSFNHSRAPIQHRVMLFLQYGPAQYRVLLSSSLPS